jgi:hypothetical protein
VRLRQVRGPSHDHRAAAEGLRDPFLDLLLQAVHLHGRQELAVGQLWKSVTAAADAGEPLGVVVPGRDVLVPDRPVDAVAVARVRLEVEIAPAVRLAAPQQRSAADVIPAHPVEALDFGVGVLDVVDEPVRRRRVGRVAGAGLLFLLGEIRRREAVAAGELPALHHRGGIVGMLDVAPAFEHERAQPFLRQLLGRPTSADARSDDDGVVGAFGRAASLHEHA